MCITLPGMFVKATTIFRITEMDEEYNLISQDLDNSREIQKQVFLYDMSLKSLAGMGCKRLSGCHTKYMPMYFVLRFGK